MAFAIADRVRETTTTTGTGTIDLGGAVTNFETFTANLSNGDTTYYAIVDNTNNAFEVGLGTFATGSPNTLARTTIIASSNSNSAVTLGSGTKDVFITIPASKLVVEDGSNNVAIGGTVTATAFSGSGASLTGVDVVNDTSPQLGGNLDMNGNDIITTSNADLELAPNGTGKVVVKGNSNQGAIKLNCEANSHGQTIIAAPHSESANNTLTLPSTGGDARLVSATSTATLTNKTLTSPVIETVTGSTITLDSAGDINLDAGGADVTLKDDGTTFGSLTNSSGELVIKSGSTPTTALTFSGANVTVAGDLTVSGTTTTVDSTTINVQNTLVFEGSTANDHETTLTTVDPTADRTISLPNQSGTLPVLAAASTTQITSTPEELNILDGVTATASELNILDGVTATTAEVNLLDGDTSVGSSITIADSDGIIVNDGGTMKSVPASDVKTYAAGDSASKGFATAMAIAL